MPWSRSREGAKGSSERRGNRASMKKQHQKRSGGGDDLLLHTAARNGDISSIISILASNSSLVNFRDKHSRTPLHLAAWSGKIEAVNYLCKNKADVGATAMDDMGAIHFASQKGHLDVVRALVSFGGSVKASTRKGMTPLHYAVQGSYLELVKYLVKKGGSVTTKTKTGMTPLDLATDEEIRSFLEESERLPRKEDLNEKRNDEKPESKPSISDGEEGSSNFGITEAGVDEQPDGEKLKRKSDEDGVLEASSGRKKVKVSLNHLLSADDTEAEENS